jgi:NADH:ubiquinone oxidoreductase subunit K
LAEVGLQEYLIVGLGLFCLGFYCVLTRRNAIGILMGVELILNAANVNFIAFNHFVEGPGKLTGQVFSIFVIVLAAAEAAIGLAIVLAIYQTFRTIDVEETDLLRE